VAHRPLKQVSEQMKRTKWHPVAQTSAAEKEEEPTF